MSQRSASGASSHILHQQLFEPNRMSYQSQRIRARQDEQPTSVALKELGTATSSVVPVLEVDPVTLTRRLETRPDDVFGGRPLERTHTLRMLESRSDIPRNAISIIATAPVTRVVDSILSYCDIS